MQLRYFSDGQSSNSIVSVQKIEKKMLFYLEEKKNFWELETYLSKHPNASQKTLLMGKNMQH